MSNSRTLVEHKKAAANIVRPQMLGVRRIALFFLIIAILAYALNATISRGLRRIETSKFGALNAIMTGRATADVVISGSSRALNHYDPETLQSITGLSAYNIGMNASQIDLQRVILKAYLKHNARPRMIIQNLDVFSFENTKRGEIYEPGTYIPYIDDDELYEGLRSIDPNVLKWRHVPLYGYAVEDMQFCWIRGVLGLAGIMPQEDYRRGFNPRDKAWTQEFARYQAAHPVGVSQKVEEDGVANLKGIAELCRDASIPLIMVYSPEHSEAQSLVTNRREIFKRFEEIAMSNGAKFWDYSDSPISRERKYFFNSQHLNADGASAFSRELARRIVEDGIVR
jgi:hypothetical protein